MNKHRPFPVVFARILTILCFLVPAVASTQSPAPLPQPDLQLLRAGSVRAIARQPDGSLLIGGSFTSVAGTPRNRIARILPDGTVDPDWNPSSNGVVNALAVDASGAVYVGGRFTSIGGLPRNRIAKLSGTGTGSADVTWNPTANNDVSALAIDASGALIAGGRFSFIGGLGRVCIAKLSATGVGSADPVWSPHANFWVESLAVDSSGAVYAGGQFTTIGGLPRMHIAKLSGNGAGNVDPIWNPVADGAVYDLALAPDGALFAGGSFSAIGGASRNHLAKLASTGTGNADPSWNPAPDDVPEALAVDSNGRIYVGGKFSSIGGQPRAHVARLSTSGTGAVDSNWRPLANAGPLTFAAGTDGSVTMGGSFSIIDGQSRLGIAEISDNGQVIGVPSDVAQPGYVTASVNQPDGGLIVAGGFSKANGQARSGLLRLNPDWSLDPEWAPDVNGLVKTLAVNSVGEVYAGGTFTAIGGQPIARLARLAADGNGAADPSWNPAPNDEVSSIALDSSGAIHVGGSFSSIGGANRAYLAKLSATGSGLAEPGWNPSPNESVGALAFDTSDILYVGGLFTQIGGQPHGYIARILSSSSGSVDSTWNPFADWSIIALATDSIGSVYAGGYYSQMNGQPRAGIAKLSSVDGSLDLAWNPSVDGTVNALALDESSHVYVGGEFTAIGGQLRSNLARLSVDGSGNADPDWNPSPNSFIDSLTVGSNGILHVGGWFTSIGSTPRNGLATLAISNLVFQDGFDGASNRHGGRTH